MTLTRPARNSLGATISRVQLRCFDCRRTLRGVRDSSLCNFDVLRFTFTANEAAALQHGGLASAARARKGVQNDTARRGDEATQI